MKSPNKRELDRIATRTAILDATEALMAEEGYAGVTTRRVAERAGLKSQLVHYHFGTMDELFRAAMRRNEQRHFEVLLKTAANRNPLRALWNTDTAPKGMNVVLEYEAAARHRKVLREDLTEMWFRFQSHRETMVGKYFAERGIDPGTYTPQFLTFLISALGHQLESESSMGFTQNHSKVRAFMDKLLEELSGDQEPDQFA